MHEMLFSVLLNNVYIEIVYLNKKNKELENCGITLDTRTCTQKTFPIL